MKAILAPNGQPARLTMRNHYDAAQQPAHRSTLQGVVQGANLDATPMVRKTLNRCTRTLYKNSPFVRGMIERAITLAVGAGLIALPSSGSKRYNDASRMRLVKWQKRPALRCPFRWRQIQRIILRAMLVDGEVFVYIASKDGEPRIRILESHTIGRGITTAYSGKPDGIELDGDGEPVAYHYYPDDRAPTFIRLGADSVVHFMFPERADLYRGVTPLHAVITTAHDVHDILAMEKAAVKDVSKRTDIIKTTSGEVDLETMHANGGTIPQSTTEPGTFYEKVFGPEAKVLRIGDEYTPYEPKRPGPAWQGFMDFLSQLCCLGLNMPPQVFLPMKIGGADTRATWAAAARVIELWQEDLVPGFESIINAVQFDDIANRRVSNSPADWDSLTWQFPRRVTSDYGRDSKSDREDVKMGMLSLRDYYGAEGCNWEDELRQIAKEQAFIREIAEEEGLKPEDVMMKNPNQQLGQDSVSEPAKPTE